MLEIASTRLWTFRYRAGLGGVRPVATFPTCNPEAVSSAVKPGEDNLAAKMIRCHEVAPRHRFFIVRRQRPPVDLIFWAKGPVVVVVVVEGLSHLAGIHQGHQPFLIGVTCVCYQTRSPSANITLLLQWAELDDS